MRARPIKAALASAASFMLGALVPILAIRLAPENRIGGVTTGAALVTLAILGGLSARGGCCAAERAADAGVWGPRHGHHGPGGAPGRSGWLQARNRAPSSSSSRAGTASI